ncbi:MAG: hypothetical protein FWC03_10580 [Treponema sp.]|nr:hypothetical protein [Treponema sp.]
MKNNNSLWFNPSAEYASNPMDTHYYGVFLKDADGSVAIDPKRWEECFNSQNGLPDHVKRIMDER